MSAVLPEGSGQTAPALDMDASAQPGFEYAKVLLVDEQPAAYCQFGPLTAYPRAQRLRDLAALRRARDRMDRDHAQPLDVEALARGAPAKPRTPSGG